jgi:hypothetical protein
VRTEAGPGEGRLLALPILGATLAAFAGTLAGGALYFRDLHLFHRPVRVVVRRLWGEGFLPVWDPLQDGGRHLLANPNHRVLHPTALLDALLSVDAAIAAAAVLQVFLAGWGLALLLKDAGSTPAAARVGGVAYALSGPVLSLGNLPNLMGGVAWVPLILWAGGRAAREPARWLPAAALLAAVPLTAGAPEAALVALAILAACSLTGPGRVRRLLLVAGTGLGAGLLAAFQVLPAVAMLGETERGIGFRPELAYHWSMAPVRLLEAAVPGLWGVATDPGRWWGDGVFDMGLPLILSSYLGAGVLVLAGTGLAGAIWPHGPTGRREGRAPGEPDRALPAGLRRLVLATAAVGAALVFVALGRHNPLLTSLSGESPGGAVLRYPERLLPLACFPVAISAAAGWQVIAAARKEGRRLPRSWWIALGGAASLLVAVSVMAAARKLFTILGVALSAERLPEASGFLLQSCSMGLLGLSLAAACVWLAGRRGWEGLAAAFCPLLLAVDLLAVNVSLNPTVNPQLLREVPPAAVAIQEAAGGGRFPPRLLRRSHAPVEVEGVSPGAEIAWWRRSLSDRIPTEHGIGTSLVKDIDRSAPVGHAFLRVAYQQAAGASRERMADRAAAGWELGFARSPDDVPDGARLVDQVFSGAAGLWLRKRPGAPPVVDVVPRGVALGSLRDAETLPTLIGKLGEPATDPRQTVFLTGSAAPPMDGGWNPGGAEVEVTRQSPVELVVEAVLPGPGVLVVRQSLTQGWTAEVDGAAAEIFRADLAWRGVPLEEGRHTVRFAFHQPGLAAGTLVTSTGLLLSVGLVASQGVRGRRRKAAVSRDGLESRRS